MIEGTRARKIHQRFAFNINFEVLAMNIAHAIRNWWRNRRLMHYGLRAAELNDVDFILAEVLAGTHAGHYVAQQQESLRAMLTDVIQLHKYARRSDNAPMEILFARLWIYGAERDNTVGFLLVSETEPGSAICQHELYMMGVRRDRRGTGHGQQLLRLCLSAYRDMVLYARCLPCSDTMFHLLKRNHFQHFQTMRQGTRALVWRQNKIADSLLDFATENGISCHTVV